MDDIEALAFASCIVLDGFLRFCVYPTFLVVLGLYISVLHWVLLDNGRA